jgi:hypothetical protein
MPSQFDASASRDADGTVVGYIWDFGDSTPLQAGPPTLTHSYAKSGTYTARLTVTDDAGCSTTFVFTGQTAYCNGGTAATTTRTFTVSLPTPTVPAPAPVPAPVLSSLRVSPRTFSLTGRRRNGRCRTSIKSSNAAEACHRPIKLTISYALSARTTVTFTLARELPGRKVDGHCVRPSQANDTQRRCTRLVPVRGRIIRMGNAGGNRLRFSGAIGGHNLGPATYQLTVTPAGGIPQTTTFTIAP